ncbi:MAG: methylenetetrahydrofolate--tRNA-(uracil(54)-C(5))-methyltransferase (FADH(2)-oxidizing) TrmFO [bacterium]|nr:methylenetetrahydrofolate--tRNA-(uracil(54)-C(5))-methyltransferase (FADH(2)-oxidizing) TrmFO [bacterium]
MNWPITIVGGGLSGSEAALQLAARGIAVELWEQRSEPDAECNYSTPAHATASLAELVCSNSFKSTDPERAPGLLKEELRHLGCHLLEIADRFQIPGGAALVVDREAFSAEVTRVVEGNPLITLRREHYALLHEELAEGRIVLLATGPLTSDSLWEQLSEIVGGERMYFYDATSPILEAGTVDMDVAFALSRYGKGGGEDYINCPFDREQYTAFREALLGAEVYPVHGGDSYKLFEGCLPIEELAARGEDTMRYGPLKPRGLTDPRTGREPYAAVQLRWEDAFKSAMGLVGFQTRLRFGEQQRVFGMIPGLAGVKFIRYGRMHRNCYVEAPKVMLPTLQVQDQPRLLLAGQITGLEGYLSAVATGVWAGRNIARMVNSLPAEVPPETSCLGSMLRFMTNTAHKKYAPTGFQFGMLKWLPERIKPREKSALIRRKAEESWAEMTGDQPASSEPMLRSSG